MDDKLYEGDWNYVLNTIYRLNGFEDLASFQRKALDYVRLSIPFCQGLFHIYKRDENGGIALLQEPVIVGVEALYLDEFNRKFARDAYFSRVALSVTSSVTRDTDLMPDELRVNTDWYREIYAKQGIHFALRSHLTHDGIMFGSVDLFRPKEDRNFSDKEMRILETLTPHIAQKLAQLLSARGAEGNQDKLNRLLSSSYGLTTRECEVVKMLMSEKPDKTVANELCISLSTLKKHIHNVYGKIGVRTRRQLYSEVDKLRD